MRHRNISAITQEHAVTVIGGDRLDAICQCVERAENRWVQEHLPLFKLPTKSLMAATLNHLVIEELTLGLGSVHGIQLHTSPPATRFYVVIDNSVLLVFKKVDGNLQTANYPTPTAIAFDQQEVSPEFKALPRLKVGWAVNAFGTSLTGIYLFQAFGKAVVWYRELRSGEGTVALPLGMPAPSLTPRPGTIAFPSRPAGQGAADLEAEADSARRQRSSVQLADGGDRGA